MIRTRKIIKTGNSLAVTIPCRAIKLFDLKEGELAQYKLSRSRGTITYIFTGHPRQLSLINSK